MQDLKLKLKDYLEGTKIPAIDRAQFADIMHKLHIFDDNIIETYHTHLFYDLLIIYSNFRAWDTNIDGKIDFSEVMILSFFTC
jgi:hypothetical protein